MEVAVTTDVGSVQRHNDDGWCAEQLHRNVTLLAVADGFGRPHGASSSSLVLDAVLSTVRRELKQAAPARSLTGADVRELLIHAFRHASERLLHASGGDEDHVVAASTCTAILIVSNEAFIAHVGDSRAYLIRRGEVVQLTTDESIVPELVASRSGLPRGLRHRHARPLLTRALGLDTQNIAPKVTHHTLHAQDSILFCTDGVYRAIGLQDLQTAVNTKEQRAEWVSDRIVALARAAGSVDNATVLLVRDATEHGAPAERKEELLPARSRRPMTAWLAAVAAILGLAISMLWAMDTRLYLGSDAHGIVTLYSGSPLSVFGIPLHIARNNYSITTGRLSEAVQQELDRGLTVSSPGAAAAIVAQWQSKTHN